MGDAIDPKLLVLMDVLDKAYTHARRTVYDVVQPGIDPRSVPLSEAQHAALDAHEAAERAVEAAREELRDEPPTG